MTLIYVDSSFNVLEGFTSLTNDANNLCYAYMIRLIITLLHDPLNYNITS